MKHPTVKRILIRRMTFAVIVLAFVAGVGVAGARIVSRFWNASSSTPQESVPPTPTPMPTLVPRDVLRDSADRLDTDVYAQVAPALARVRVLQPRQPYERSDGLGLVWDDQGHVITNYHVIDGAEEVEISFLDNTTLPAQVVGTDPDSDLAVLRVDAPPDRFRAIEAGDVDAISIGQPAIVVGNLLGQEWALTTGLVVALGRSMPSPASQFSIPDMIQTAAPLHGTNAGGPLLDQEGHLIGVNTIISPPNMDSIGFVLAIPVDVLEQVVPLLIKEGRYAYAWLGITGREVNPIMAEIMGLPPASRGALVISVSEDGPAQEAGVRASDETITIAGTEVEIGGDVILAIDDHPVTDMDDIIVYLVKQTRPGQKITLSVLREGEQHQIEVTLGERPRLP